MSSPHPEADVREDGEWTEGKLTSGGTEHSAARARTARPRAARRARPRGSTAVDWVMITAAVAGLAAVGVLLVRLLLRYNQLSLAADLCREGRRQLTADIADRHLLIPPFVEATRARLGECPAGDELASAFQAARRALDTGECDRIGTAEEALTEATAGLAAAVHAELRAAAAPRAGSREDSMMETLRYLYSQIIAIEGRIAAAARYYNRNVDRYHARRGLPLSAPLRGIFRPCAPIRYSDLTLDPLESSADALRVIDEDYRPGRLSEEL